MDTPKWRQHRPLIRISPSYYSFTSLTKRVVNDFYLLYSLFQPFATFNPILFGFVLLSRISGKPQGPNAHSNCFYNQTILLLVALENRRFDINFVHTDVQRKFSICESRKRKANVSVTHSVGSHLDLIHTITIKWYTTFS